MSEIIHPKPNKQTSTPTMITNPSPSQFSTSSPSNSIPITPKSPFITRVMTPLASPMKKAMASMQGYLEFTKLNPHDEWLPITESRNGNAFYAAFHTLSSGIGIQALVLPLAFTALGWLVYFPTP